MYLKNKIAKRLIPHIQLLVNRAGFISRKRNSSDDITRKNTTPVHVTFPLRHAEDDSGKIDIWNNTDVIISVAKLIVHSPVGKLV